MELSKYENDMQHLLEQAGILLGCEVRAVELDWELEQILADHLRSEQRQGISSKFAQMLFDDGRPGHEVVYGLERFCLRVDEVDLKLVKITLPCCVRIADFWAVSVNDHRKLFRFLRQRLRKTRFQEPPIMDDETQPIMDDETQRRLWGNTIGFLRHDNQLLKRYGVPRKRGVLMLGKPGNGKTMACRWLRSQCQRYGLDWSSVTRQQYEAALQDGDVSYLFQPDRVGIVLFDDFDEPLKYRDSSSDSRDQTTFMSQLDGICPKSGVVYLFTSNMKIEEVDPALRRPGRIDDVVPFAAPDATLRRRFILDRWNADIVAGVSVEQVVTETAGLSFAEIEEAKKLLVLHYLDSGKFDWPRVCEMLGQRADLVKAERVIGFSNAVGRSQQGVEETVAEGRDALDCN